MLRKLLLIPAFLAAAMPAFAAAAIDPTRAIGLTPDQIVWKKGVNNDTAWPIGDPKTPGACLELIRWHPTYFSRPHYHANDRYVMVVSGTWWVGTGATFDPEHATVPLKAGTFAIHPGRQVHYDGARSGGEEAIVMIVGERGPGARVECEGPTAEKTPGPCLDAINVAGAK